MKVRFLGNKLSGFWGKQVTTQNELFKGLFVLFKMSSASFHVCWLTQIAEMWTDLRQEDGRLFTGCSVLRSAPPVRTADTCRAPSRVVVKTLPQLVCIEKWRSICRREEHHISVTLEHFPSCKCLWDSDNCGWTPDAWRHLRERRRRLRSELSFKDQSGYVLWSLGVFSPPWSASTTPAVSAELKTKELLATGFQPATLTG